MLCNLDYNLKRILKATLRLYHETNENSNIDMARVLLKKNSKILRHMKINMNNFENSSERNQATVSCFAVTKYRSIYSLNIKLSSHNHYFLVYIKNL